MCFQIQKMLHWRKGTKRKESISQINWNERQYKKGIKYFVKLTIIAIEVTLGRATSKVGSVGGMKACGPRVPSSNLTRGEISMNKFSELTGLIDGNF